MRFLVVIFTACVIFPGIASSQMQTNKEFSKKDGPVTDWTFIKTSPTEKEVVHLLGKPSKAGTLYDQVDYETFHKINKLDMYMLEYAASNLQSPLGVNASNIRIWFRKGRTSSADLTFSGKEKDQAYAAFKWDKKCENDNSACLLTEKCWEVKFHPSKDYKNYNEIYAEKIEDGFTYVFSCLKIAGMYTYTDYCLDDEIILTIFKTGPSKPHDQQTIQQWMKECADSKIRGQK